MDRNNEIQEKILFILRKISTKPINADDILENTVIDEKLGIDSLKMLELIIELEKEFAISFDEDDIEIEKFKTIKDISHLINEKQYENQ